MLARSSTPTTSAADRANYGQASEAKGIIFRIDVAIGHPALLKFIGAAIGTEATAAHVGVFRVIKAGVGADSSSNAFHVDGVAGGSGSNAQSLTARRPIALVLTFIP